MAKCQQLLLAVAASSSWLIVVLPAGDDHHLHFCETAWQLLGGSQYKFHRGLTPRIYIVIHGDPSCLVSPLTIEKTCVLSENSYASVWNNLLS